MVYLIFLEIEMKKKNDKAPCSFRGIIHYNAKYNTNETDSSFYKEKLEMEMKNFIKTVYDVESINHIEMSNLMDTMLDTSNYIKVPMKMFDPMTIYSPKKIQRVASALKHYIYYDENIKQWVMRKFMYPNYNIFNIKLKSELKLILAGGPPNFNKGWKDNFIDHIKRYYFVNVIREIYCSFDNLSNIMELYKQESGMDHVYCICMDGNNGIETIDKISKFKINTFNNLDTYIYTKSSVYEIERKYSDIVLKKVIDL